MNSEKFLPAKINTTKSRIILIPTTNHGKNRIRQHGKEWEVIDDRPTELVLKSVDTTFTGGSHDIRRVSKVDDPNFVIARI